MRRFIIKTHQIAGSLLSWLFLIWFLSGIVLIFKRFPHASRQERFVKLELLAAEHLQSTKPPLKSWKGKVELEMSDGKPIYRVYSGRKKQFLYDATTLASLPDCNEELAKKLASDFVGASVERVEVVSELDSWIPWSFYLPLLPFYKCYMADDAHSQVYVAKNTHSIIQKTTRKTRWLARIGAIPHWVYFVSLRSKTGTWKTVVIALSVLGIVVSVSGIFVGFYRKGKRKITPYREWNYKWHHLLGYFFGVFAFTFVFSGMVSVTGIPDWVVGSKEKRKITWNDPLKVEQHKGTDPLLIWNALRKKDGVRRIAWKTVFGQAHYFVYYQNYRTPEVYVLQGDGQIVWQKEFSEAHILQQMERRLNKFDAKLSVQNEYDYYYKSSGMFHQPLPVYRIDLNDTNTTTLLINPSTGKEVRRVSAQSRWRYWLYRVPHAFDLPIFTKADWVRKLLLIVLSCIGVVLSYTGLVISKRYLKKIKGVNSKR